MTIELYGELPTSPVVFAACDDRYFKEHASAFVYSADLAGKDVHIHVVNPTEDTYSLACVLSATTKVNTTFSFETTKVPENLDQRRTFYACLRFMVLPMIVEQAKQVLVLDIDCMVMKPFDFPQKKVGYFPRTPEPGYTGWERDGMRCLAGAVYVSSVDVAQQIANAFNGRELRWFLDQVVLSDVMSKIPEEDVEKFDMSFMDWEFTEGSVIWTGKGPRKHTNEKYVKKHREFELFSEKVREINTIILKPRLDASFKKTGLFVRGHMTHEIRKYWQMFVDKIYNQNPKHTLIMESPRWMFTKNIEKFFAVGTKFYVPHVEQHNFGGNQNTLYYMQTVFPWLFTVDSKGWGGGAKFVDTFSNEGWYDESPFNKLREYAMSGGSKFAQPKGKIYSPRGKYIFVPLQLPHDETIMWHSDVSCEEFVSAICEWAKKSSSPYVVFKGHPANISSMQPLKNIIGRAASEKCVYVTDVDLHEMIDRSEAVYVINSGTGQEAMLHDKPVVSFGRSEYQGAVIQGKIAELDSAWEMVQNESPEERSERYRRWYYWYNQNTVDVNT